MTTGRRLASLAGVLAACVPILLTTVRAATPDLRYRLWTREEGLPQGSVRGIAQTSDGYLWIATLDGLVRFDGVRMVVFARPEVPQMTSNRCLTMLVDRRGALWVGLDDGTIVWIRGPHITAFGLKDGVRFSTYDGLSEDSDGRVWATVVPEGAAMFDGTRWTPSPLSRRSQCPHYRPACRFPRCLCRAGRLEAVRCGRPHQPSDLGLRRRASASLRRWIMDDVPDARAISVDARDDAVRGSRRHAVARQ
jgi:hypothetical protein